MAPFSAQASEIYPHTINQRQDIQQQRIFSGIQDHQIGRREYRNLEQRERSVELQQRRDMRDGSLSLKERYQINQRLDRISHSINHDRHD